MNSVNDFYVLYPVYLDSTKKLSEGRKYCKDLCIKNPSFLEISNALKFLEIDCTHEIHKKHPRDFFRSGRFKINKMYGKKNIIEGIRDTILKSRTKPSVECKNTEKVQDFVTSKGDVIENKLNLVARRKIKTKKNKKK
ncbi:signal recognition particle protein [Vairimorpha necatrix]|uniref:Signal recognition particle protein n=1 Tax=Vairimorpha necatrix TaxID=6039 RepID=A0AAX4JDH9_9MICR